MWGGNPCVGPIQKGTAREAAKARRTHGFKGGCRSNLALEGGRIGPLVSAVSCELKKIGGLFQREDAGFLVLGRGPFDALVDVGLDPPMT